jgi:hypothetical protein
LSKKKKRKDKQREEREMVDKKNPHAVALGRVGGKSRSKAKVAAARRNAKLGGWPKGKKRKPRGAGDGAQAQAAPES